MVNSKLSVLIIVAIAFEPSFVDRLCVKEVARMWPCSS